MEDLIEEIAETIYERHPILDDGIRLEWSDLRDDEREEYRATARIVVGRCANRCSVSCTT